MDLYKMKQGCQSFENFLKEIYKMKQGCQSFENFLKEIVFMSDLIIDPVNKVLIPFSQFWASLIYEIISENWI